MATMRAMVLKEPGPVEDRRLVMSELDIPEPRTHEILVRVTACGICRTDLHVVEGELEQRLPAIIPGHQIVGVVEQIGHGVSGIQVGERVGVAWLQGTCGACRHCLSSSENLCERPEFTGWTRNGGFAEFIVANADFVYRIPDGFSDVQAAPLLCAGIIGYRALRLTGIDVWRGARVGIFGFGAAGHICIQLATNRGASVNVATRDRDKHQALAARLGAKWVGDTFESPPEELDAAIVFAPAGEIVPAALKALRKGGVLVLGGIYMTPIPAFDYSLIYGERVIRSVANNTREDGREFLAEAASIPIKTSVETFPLSAVNEAIIALKHDGIQGAGVIVIGQP